MKDVMKKIITLFCWSLSAFKYAFSFRIKTVPYEEKRQDVLLRQQNI